MYKTNAVLTAYLNNTQKDDNMIKNAPFMCTAKGESNE